MCAPAQTYVHTCPVVPPLESWDWTAPLTSPPRSVDRSQNSSAHWGGWHKQTVSPTPLAWQSFSKSDKALPLGVVSVCLAVDAQKTGKESRTSLYRWLDAKLSLNKHITAAVGWTLNGWRITELKSSLGEPKVHKTTSMSMAVWEAFKIRIIRGTKSWKYKAKSPQH